MFESFRERWLKFDHETRQRNPTLTYENISVSKNILAASATQHDAHLLDETPRYKILQTPQRLLVNESHEHEFDPMTTMGLLETGKSRPVYPRQRLGRAPRTKAEALQEIRLVVDDRLSARMVTSIDSLEAQMRVSSSRLPHENIIIWRRSTHNTDQETETSFILIVLDAQEIYNELKTGELSLVESFLHRWKASIPKTYSDIYMLITGGKSLGSRISAEINRKFRRCVISGSRLKLTPTKTLPAWIEIEQLLWLAGLELGIHVQFLDRATQLSEHLLEMSRCIAWHPYALRHEHHSFCTLSSKRSGKSLSETWKLMLQEIGRVSPTIADAILGTFPTAASLMAEYGSLPSEIASDLLSIIAIPGSQRCVGSAISQRIYRALTSQNPSLRANAT